MCGNAHNTPIHLISGVIRICSVQYFTAPTGGWAGITHGSAAPLCVLSSAQARQATAWRPYEEISYAFETAKGDGAMFRRVVEDATRHIIASLP